MTGHDLVTIVMTRCQYRLCWSPKVMTGHGHELVTKVMTGHDVWGVPPQEPCGTSFFWGVSRFFLFGFQFFCFWIVSFWIFFSFWIGLNTRVNNLFTRSLYLIRVSLVWISQWILWMFYLFSIFSDSLVCLSVSSRTRNDIKLFLGYWLIWLCCIIGFLGLYKTFTNKSNKPD